jgi:hypothetical protein
MQLWFGSRSNKHSDIKTIGEEEIARKGWFEGIIFV